MTSIVRLKKYLIMIGLIFFNCIIWQAIASYVAFNFRESTKHGPLVHGPPPWTRSMDPLSWAGSMDPYFYHP